MQAYGACCARQSEGWSWCLSWVHGGRQWTCRACTFCGNQAQYCTGANGSEGRAQAASASAGPERAEVQLREAWRCTATAAVLAAPAAVPGSGSDVLAGVEGMLQALSFHGAAPQLGKGTQVHSQPQKVHQAFKPGEAGPAPTPPACSLSQPSGALHGHGARWLPILSGTISGTTLALYCRTTNMSVLSRAHSRRLTAVCTFTHTHARPHP